MLKNHILSAVRRQLHAAIIISCLTEATLVLWKKFDTFRDIVRVTDKSANSLLQADTHRNRMKLKTTPQHFTLSCALFSATLLSSSLAQVTPGGTFLDKAILTESTGGETIARATTGTGLGPALVHDFDTSAVDATYELTAPTTLALSSGRHLVIYSTRFDKSAGTNRAEFISNLTLAGTQLQAGTSQGFIRRTGGSDETVMSGGAIINVTADDDIITLETRRSDTNTDTNLPAREPNYTSMQLLRLDDSWPYLNLQRSTNQAGTVGTGGANVTFETDNSAGTHGSAFSYTAGSSDITLNETGLYLVFANTKLEKTAGNGTRTNYFQTLTLDNSEIAGSKTTTYLRGNANGENAQSGVAAVGRIVSATAGQVLRVRVEMESGGSASTIQGNGTAITAVKLPVSAKYAELTDTTNQNVLNTAATAIAFNTQVSPANSTFTHSGGSTLTANNAGDYLFFGGLFTQSDSVNDNHDRVIPITRWRQNSSTLLDRGQGGAYNRDSDGNRTSGSWNSTLITLGAGDTVEMTSENIGTASASFPNTPFMQGLELASLIVNNDPAIATNLPFTVLPSATGNIITDAFLDTFDNDTAPASLTYTLDTAPTGGTLRNNGAALGVGGTFTQDDVDNGLVTFDAGASAPLAGGFDFTVSDGSATDSSTFVINVEWPVTTVTITGNGNVTEGGNVDLDFTADVAPIGADLTVTVAYSGSADGSDFTGVTTVDILDGATSAVLNISTIADGLFEGAESVTVTITNVSGTTITGAIGTPSAATFLINDGANSAPSGTNLSQVIAGAGTIPITDIVVTEPDTFYNSEVTGAGAPLFVTNGIANTTVFGDGRADDDTSFDIDSGGPALSQTAGFSLEIAFIPEAGDLTGVVDLWEIGGSSNGSALLLIDGVPHLLSKAGGTSANAPTDDGSVAGAFTDLSWTTDNTVVIPLNGATTLTAGLPARLAVVFDIASNTVKSSVNGSSEATATLTGNDSNNWIGDHTVNTGANAGSGTGGSSTPSGLALQSTLKNLAGGSGTVSSVRFWNNATGSATGTAGALDSVTATLTIDGWASAANGTLTAASGNGETFVGGVWSVTGDITTVNAALAAVEFITGGSTADPTVIDVSIDDGDEDGGGPITGAIIYTAVAPDPIYVDDSFTGTIGDPVADGDLGDAGAQPATLGLNAFTTLTGALGAVTPTGTIIVNDGDYSTEDATLADTVTLQLTDTAGPVRIGNLGAGETNSIVLQGSNTLEVGALNIDTPGVDSPISGTGNVTKVGTGVFIIRETATYTGITTVLDGRFRIGYIGGSDLQGELAGDGPVVVTAPGRLEFNTGADRTLNQTGVISGTGSVGTLGDGTVVFDGPANTFSGGFELGDGSGSTFNGTTGNKNGFVVVNHNDHLGAGLVRSRGAQLQAGTTGIVIPNDITIDAGGFRCGGSNDFELSGNLTNINNDPRGWGNYGLEGLDLTASGSVTLPTATGTLNFEGTEGADNGTWTISGDISGIGNVLLQNNFDNGDVTISGTNTYTGTTTTGGSAVNASLTFNGNHTGGGDYVVNNNAIFAGTGTMDSVLTVNSAATLSPGVNSTGLLSIGGLVLNGTLSVDVDNTTGVAGTGWDQVSVTGAVTLAGGLAVTQSATVEASPTDIVVISNDAADAVTGTFSFGVPFTNDYLGSATSGGVGYVNGDGNDVVFTAGALNIIGNWRMTNFGTGANSGNGANTSDAGDSDGLVNLLEFAFGTDPNAADQVGLVIDGSVNGVPIVNADFSGPGVAFDAIFVRRDDFGISGSLDYTAQFSGDLITWHDSTDTPTVVADSTDDSDYEVVSVPYPFFTPDGKKARFFRVKVTLVP